MEDLPQGSAVNKNDVDYGRMDMFNIVKHHWSSSLDCQIDILEYTLKKMCNNFIIHPDSKYEIKKLLCKMKSKWIACRRVKDRFLQQNEEWLKSSINIKNAFSTEEIATGPTESPKGSEEGSSKRGRPPTMFENANKRTKIRRSSELCTKHSTAELAHAATMSLRASGAVTAANVLQNITTKSPERATKYQSAIKSTQIPTATQMSADVALSTMVEAKLTKHQYNVVRDSALAVSSPAFPPYNPNVLNAKKLCYPNYITITETNAEVKLQSLLDHTSERIVRVAQDCIETLDSHSFISFRLLLKWGCDGSSGHSEYKQKFTDKDSSDASVFLMSLVPLQMVTINRSSEEKDIVWSNPRPSSPRFCRPIRIQFIRESKEAIVAEVQYINSQIKALNSFEICVQGNKISIQYELIFTMIDGKVINAVTDTKSAMRCYLCQATSKEFQNLDLIRKKTIEITKLNFGLSTLHAWIRLFECLLHIGYRVEVKKWQARGEDSEEIKKRKAKIQNDFKNKMGLIVDQPKPGFGSSNDGNTARRFFEDTAKSAKILGVDETLIYRFHVILQVISCGLSIDVDKFRKYCNETAEYYVQKYPWFYMPTTVHKVLMHGAEIIEAAVLPIALLSEDAQESRNKDIKRLRECFSRKTSRKETLEDVFHGLMVSSDPVISSIRKLPSKESKSLPPEAKSLLNA